MLRNVNEVKDSAKEKKQYAIVAQAGQRLAEGCEKLKDVNEELLPKAVEQYGGLSWWALLAKDYALSEKAASRCLELDKTQERVIANHGHSQLLRGQYDKARATYSKLKGKKNGEGKNYKEILLKDFAYLEAEGISHKDMARMKAEIEKW